MYFSGVDMLDGTPVLDIKPYIPQYDNPYHMGYEYDLNTSLPKLGDTCDNLGEQNDCIHLPREAPDGEECDVPDCSTKIVPFSPHPMEQVG